MGSSNTKGLKPYQKSLNKFDDFVKKINKEASKNLSYIGYIINFNKFKQFKEYVEEYNQQDEDFACGQIDRISNLKISPENPDHLIFQMNNKSKFIIISGDLHEKICKKKDLYTHQITYLISPEIIQLNIENGKSLIFKNNKNNILKKELFLKIIKNDNDINQSPEIIYKDIINYYKFTNKFSENINSKNREKEEYEGFLINKEWVDKWKVYSCYEIIKEKYLENNIEDKDKIIEEIKKDQKNSIVINDIEGFIIKDLNQFQSEENSDEFFEILDKNFLKSFENNIQKKVMPFELIISYQNIEIKSENKRSISFKTLNNIIYK